MKRHKILIQSGFGRYLIGMKQNSIGNEFLYYEPSLLLWVDEIICDKHALEGKKKSGQKKDIRSARYSSSLRIKD